MKGDKRIMKKILLAGIVVLMTFMGVACGTEDLKTLEAENEMPVQENYTKLMLAPTSGASKEELEDTIYTITKYLDEFEAETKVLQKDGQIEIRAFDYKDAEKLEQYVLQNRELHFVLYTDLTGEEDYLLEGNQVKYSEENILLSGNMISEAQATTEKISEVDLTEHVVQINFDEKGAKKFAEITEKHIGEQLAIVYGGKLITAPTINGAITEGEAIISGGFATLEEAEELARSLRIGSIPISLEVVSSTYVEK